MGYLDKLSSKIIDNIQIDIKNIHIRLEDQTTSGEPWRLGSTLKELKLYTCNSDWKQTYIDRTLKDNKGLPLFKLLNLSNFAFYFQSDEQNLASVNCSSDDECEDFMRNMFPLKAEYIKDTNYLIEPSKF